MEILESPESSKPSKRRIRKMTIAIWVWCGLIVVWAIAGAASVSDCANEQGSGFLTHEDAQSACETGAGIGILVILLIGFFGFVFLSLIWFMTRPREQQVVIVRDER